jgi:hypothetical protein
MTRREYREAKSALLSSNHISLRVSLSAEDNTGRRIEGSGGFRIGGSRRGVSAIWVRYHGPPLPVDEKKRIDFLRRTYRVGLHDIEDAINIMLGRDPTSDKGPKIPWEGLAAALAQAGIHMTEDELISAPLVVELDHDVQVELERG